MGGAMAVTSSIKNTLRRARHVVNQALGRDVRAPIQVHCHRELLGSEYGGWCVCPDNLNARSVVYSFGVGQDISWDLAMIRRFGVHVHAFDPTPKSIEWIKSQSLPEQLHFHEYGIAAHDGTAQFALPRADYVSYAMSDGQNSGAADVVVAPVRRLETLMEMLGHSGRRIDVLKMDIEGAEIEVISSLASTGVQIDQFLVEFHHTVGRPVEIDASERAIGLINQMGLKLFFVSAVGKEFSFIRA
jgi:FkbM family methyltransferase